MISLETFHAQAAALPDSTEQLHFGLRAFAVGKRRFAAFDPRRGEIVVRLPQGNPARAQALSQGILSPAAGKYGTEGWCVLSELAGEQELSSLLQSAHAAACPKLRRPGT